MKRRSRVLMALTSLPVLASGVLTLGLAPPALADGPGVGPPTIVSMGDGTVSGEGGRWAGNTTNPTWWQVDALGASAYWDQPTGELVAGCHRSRSAEVHIGVDATGRPVHSLNLACSGAGTTTYDYAGEPFKPGLDNRVDGARSDHSGQAALLTDYARAHNVTAILVRVGASDVGLDHVIVTCQQGWSGWMAMIGSGRVRPSQTLCSHDPDLTGRFTPAAQDDLEQRILESLSTIADDMTRAGYTRDMYSVIVETYASPFPPGNRFRYPEDSAARAEVGGCGIFNADADWMNNTVFPALNTTLRGAATQFAAAPGAPEVHVLDDQHVLDGHRLCEQGAALVEDLPVTGHERRWSDPGAMYNLEWVQQLKTPAALWNTPYATQEGGYADYFGQLAERACLRMEYDSGSPVDATCYPGAFSSPPSWPPTGSSSSPWLVWKAPPVTHLPGEPLMSLGPLAAQVPPHL